MLALRSVDPGVVRKHRGGVVLRIDRQRDQANLVRVRPRIQPVVQLDLFRGLQRARPPAPRENKIRDPDFPLKVSRSEGNAALIRQFEVGQRKENPHRFRILSGGVLPAVLLSTTRSKA